MKLVLQTRKEFIDLTKTPSATGEYYYEYEQIEIESFRWGKITSFPLLKKVVILGQNLKKMKK